jgi:hypothetical protein
MQQLASYRLFRNTRRSVLSWAGAHRKFACFTLPASKTKPLTRQRDAKLVIRRAVRFLPQ